MKKNALFIVLCSGLLFLSGCSGIGKKQGDVSFGSPKKPLVSGAAMASYPTKITPVAADKALITDSSNGQTRNAELGAFPVSTPVQTALNAKENSLGNPGTSGWCLQSTTGGIRSWGVCGSGGLTSLPTGSGQTIMSNGVGTYAWFDSVDLTVTSPLSLNTTTGELGIDLSNYSLSSHNHTGTYQPASANLTTYAGIAPSANVQSLLGAANYAAIKTLLDTDDIQTLTGIAAGTAHLGTFTGTTIADSSTIKTALQSLETAVESAGGGGLTTAQIDSSSELLSIVGDETGSASGTPLLVFNQSPRIDNIELGAATDTTISRSAAGVLAVEGVALTRTIASGTSALGTGAIASGACATVVTTSATNTATTDTIGWGFNGDPTGVTGYQASANGMLTIIAYPSANNVNFKVCNNTAASVTPGGITLNWRVMR